MYYRLIILFVTAAVFRLISLNQSLWLDEAITAKAAQLPVEELVFRFSPTDFHSPFYYLLMKYWTAFFGNSEVTLRFPSLIFSLAAGLFVYLIGAKLKNDSVGFWAAAFFLFNPLIIYYSQEARMYLMSCFWVVVLWYFLFLLLDKKRPNESQKIGLIGFNVVSALAFLTFYGTVFVVLSIYIYLAIRREWRLLIKLAPGFILALITLSPLIYRQFQNARQSLFVVGNWKATLGAVSLKNILLIPLKFAVGRVSFLPKYIYYLFAGVWTAYLLSISLLACRNRRLVYFITAPLVLGVVFSFFTPLLQYFRFLYLLPLMCVFLAFAAKGRFNRWFILSGFISWSVVYLIFPAFHREDWRSLSWYLASKTERIYMIESVSDPLRYYRYQGRIVDLRNLEKQPIPTIIYLIPYASEIYNFNYSSILANRGYYQVEKTDFHGVSFEVWQTRSH